MNKLKEAIDKRFDVALSCMEKSLAAIKKIYSAGFEIKFKEDDSPVTDADIASDKIIRDDLLGAFPDDGYLSEEEADDLARLEKEFVWIVDPLDGTEDFVQRDGMFCVNLALCKGHELVMGLVGVPLTGEIFFAKRGEGAFLRSKDGQLTELHVSKRKDELRAVTSAYHTGENDMKAYQNPAIKELRKLGSSLKACAIASGQAEICLKLEEGTKEWDTAAPQILVEEAGGLYLKPSLDKMIYNRIDVYNRDGFAIGNSYQNLIKILKK